jgi:hypothetical protein
MQLEPLEDRALLSRPLPAFTRELSQRVAREIADAVGKAATAHDLALLRASLPGIASQLPYGRIQILPIWNSLVRSFSLSAPGSARTLAHELLGAVRTVAHDDAAAGILRASGRKSLGAPTSAFPAPFVANSRFSFQGTNFLTTTPNTPAFVVGPQTFNQGRLIFTLNVVNDNGRLWIDMDLQRPPGSTPRSLAGNANAPWQAGPIGGIQLSGRTMLNNIFFYFTVDNIPVSTGLQPIQGQITVGANPISVLRPVIPQVFLFSNFRPGIANQFLSLGSGIATGSGTYANFLRQLNVPANANGLHIDFWATPAPA